MKEMLALRVNIIFIAVIFMIFNTWSSDTHRAVNRHDDHNHDTENHEIEEIGRLVRGHTNETEWTREHIALLFRRLLFRNCSDISLVMPSCALCVGVGDVMTWTGKVSYHLNERDVIDVLEAIVFILSKSEIFRLHFTLVASIV